jgi:hypothetical protein
VGRVIWCGSVNIMHTVATPQCATIAESSGPWPGIRLVSKWVIVMDQGVE